jgi:predicted SnoaL-like aldol condensation-catalyzing enzyme
MKNQSQYPIGLVLEVTYPMFSVILHLEAKDRIRFVIPTGPFAREETVAIECESLGNNQFLVSWKEKEGATVVNLQDFDAGIVHSFATLPDGTLLRNKGSIKIRENAQYLSDHSPKRNKQIVLDAMTSLFQRHDASAVDRLYATNYVQHNLTMPPGKEILKKIVSELGQDVFYEPGMTFAQGNMVAIHGRIRGWGPKPQIVVDMFRIEDGKLAEHWDVLQEEIPGSGIQMFDPKEGDQ